MTGTEMIAERVNAELLKHKDDSELQQRIATGFGWLLCFLSLAEEQATRVPLEGKGRWMQCCIQSMIRHSASYFAACDIDTRNLILALIEAEVNAFVL